MSLLSKQIRSCSDRVQLLYKDFKNACYSHAKHGFFGCLLYNEIYRIVFDLFNLYFRDEVFPSDFDFFGFRLGACVFVADHIFANYA